MPDVGARWPSIRVRVEVEALCPSWWISACWAPWPVVPPSTWPMPINWGTLARMPVTLVAPVALMSAWETVVTDEPTGAVPRMLVPVTVTDSTGAAAAACCASAGRDQALAAARATTDAARCR